MKSGAKTVAAYLAELPPERRRELEAVLEVVRRNLPPGYEEGMQFGMVGWSVPLSRYPKTYNGQPLSYAALAAQKNHLALYLMAAYADPGAEGELREAFARAGKKLDLGKSCLRFRRAADLELEAVGRAVARFPVEAFIALYERGRGGA